jgi:hypothetical protein
MCIRGVLLYVASKSGKKLNLETPTVQRTLNPNGTIMEVVMVDVSRSGITDEEIDRFVARLPLQRADGLDVATFRRCAPPSAPPF